MTWSRALLILTLVVTCAAAAFVLTRGSEPEPDCNSCSARHQDMERLRGVLTDLDNETD